LCKIYGEKSFTFDEIKLKLVNYCVYQDRCHAEVEQKMREFLLIDEAKEEIMLYLMKENYLNEERFTEAISEVSFTSNIGEKKIRMNLKQKQISEN
jgi:regulatory protein